MENKMKMNNKSPTKKQFKIELIKASSNYYNVIQNMARFYSYDMSRTCGFIGDWDWAFPENGLYEGCDVKRYFEEKDRYALLIKVDNELAGFALIHKKGLRPTTDWVMGEFFIVAKYQSKNIGTQVTQQIWQKFPGNWEATVIPQNTPALAFWRKSISQFTNNQYTEEIINMYPNTNQPDRHVLQFLSTNSSK